MLYQIWRNLFFLAAGIASTEAYCGIWWFYIWAILDPNKLWLIDITYKFNIKWTGHFKAKSLTLTPTLPTPIHFFRQNMLQWLLFKSVLSCNGYSIIMMKTHMHTLMHACMHTHTHTDRHTHMHRKNKTKKQITIKSENKQNRLKNKTKKQTHPHTYANNK